MNLLQMKQKMLELAISDKYMADCCGVAERYLKQCLAGSKRMTTKLEQKIKGVFKSIEIKRHKQEMEKEKKELDKDWEYVFGDEQKVTPHEIYELPKQPIEPKDLITKDFIKGRVAGIKYACNVIRSKMTDANLLRDDILVLFELNYELQNILDDVLNKE